MLEMEGLAGDRCRERKQTLREKRMFDSVGTVEVGELVSLQSYPCFFISGWSCLRNTLGLAVGKEWVLQDAKLVGELSPVVQLSMDGLKGGQKCRP